MRNCDDIQRRVAERLQAYGSQNLFTHAEALLGKVGEGPLAFSRYAPDDRSIFDFASLTKALVTTPLTYRAVAGDVECCLGSLWKSGKNRFAPWINNLKIRDLLRHESGLPPWRNFYVDELGPFSQERGREDRIELASRVFHRSVQNPIKSHQNPVYSDLGFILLGVALEDFYQCNLSDIFQKFLEDIDFRPLVYFAYGPVSLTERTVPTGYCAIRERSLCGEVWDENAAALGGVAGHAGLFGTASDLAHYLSCLWKDPLGKDLIEKNFAHLTPKGESLLGFRQGADPSTFAFGEGRSAGHLGFTGTSFWLRENGIYSILLTNRVIHRRIDGRIRTLREEVAKIHGEF